MLITYNLFEGRRIDDDNDIFLLFLLNDTSKFHVAVRLFCDLVLKRRPHTVKARVTHSAIALGEPRFCSKNIGTSSVHVIYFCLDARAATWNLC